MMACSEYRVVVPLEMPTSIIGRPMLEAPARMEQNTHGSNTTDWMPISQSQTLTGVEPVDTAYPCVGPNGPSTYPVPTGGIWDIGILPVASRVATPRPPRCRSAAGSARP